MKNIINQIMIVIFVRFNHIYSSDFNFFKHKCIKDRFSISFDKESL